MRVVLLALAALLAGAPVLCAQDAPPAHEEARQLYTCGMHPQVIRDAPGTCPICGMELTPIESGARAGSSATITIDPAIVQNMGVRTAKVSEGPLRRRVRAVATLREPAPGRSDINLRVSGWIERLYADVEGMHLDAGEPLFDLYSPELQVAIGELIAARQERDRGGHGAAPLLYAAARQKLALLGLEPRQVEQLARLERPPATVTFHSPRTAHLTEKLVAEGDAVQAGQRVLRLADRTRMWIDARVFEQDLALVAVGRPAIVTLPALPGVRLAGAVSFIHPHLDPVTRTALVRMDVANPDMRLRQDMFALMEIEAELAPRALLVPRAAVLDTGHEQLVFLARPNGHFEARTVTLGASGDDGHVAVLDGLAAGDEVVTSGQFLLDAESNIRAAVQRFLGATAPVGEPGAAPPAAPGAHAH